MKDHEEAVSAKMFITCLLVVSVFCSAISFFCGYKFTGVVQPQVAVALESVEVNTTASDTTYVEKRDTEVEVLAYLMFEGVPTEKLKELAKKPFKYGYAEGQYLLRGYARIELSCRLGLEYVVKIPKRGE